MQFTKLQAYPSLPFSLPFISFYPFHNNVEINFMQCISAVMQAVSALPVGDIFGPLTPGYYRYQEQGPR